MWIRDCILLTSLLNIGYSDFLYIMDSTIMGQVTGKSATMFQRLRAVNCRFARDVRYIGPSEAIACEFEQLAFTRCKREWDKTKGAKEVVCRCILLANSFKEERGCFAQRNRIFLNTKDVDYVKLGHCPMSVQN